MNVKVAFVLGPSAPAMTHSIFYGKLETGLGTKSCQYPPPTCPVTLLNFYINQSMVSYEVSLNHGHNVAIRIEPIGGTLVNGSGPCPIVYCVQDTSNVCPSNLVATNKDGKIYWLL